MLTFIYIKNMDIKTEWTVYLNLIEKNPTYQVLIRKVEKILFNFNLKELNNSVFATYG